MSIAVNRHFLPRALFFADYIRLPLRNLMDWDKRDEFLLPFIELLDRKDFDLRRVLILNDSPRAPQGSPGAAGGASVRIEAERPDRMSLAVEAPRPGFVFLSDNYYPGWLAYVNGREAPILRSWLTFRAVEVPSGKSKVEFRYEPRVLWLLLLLAAAASAAWLLLYRRYRLARASLRDEDAAGRDQKRKRNPDSAAAELAEECAAMTERVLLGYVGLTLAFWLAWSAFAYSGGPWVPWTARIMLAGLLGVFARDQARTSLR
jgi:hypothetical protein